MAPDQYGRINLVENQIYNIGKFRIKLVEGGSLDVSSVDSRMAVRPNSSNVVILEATEYP